MINKEAVLQQGVRRALMDGWLLGLAFLSELFPDLPRPNQTTEREQGWNRWVDPAFLSDRDDTGSPVLQ